MSTIASPSLPVGEPAPPAGTDTLVLGRSDFAYAELHQPRRLQDLLEAFDRDLAGADPGLAARYLAWRDTSEGAGYGPEATSALLVGVAPHVSRFLGRLFRIEAELAGLHARIAGEEVVFRFQREFLQRRVFNRFKLPLDLGGETFATLDRQASELLAAVSAGFTSEPDRERATAAAVMALFDLDRTLGEATQGKGDAGRTRAALAEAARVGGELGEPGPPEAPEAAGARVRGWLDRIERWSFARAHDPEGKRQVRHWVSYHRPEPLDYQNLVQIRRPSESRPEAMVGPDERLRRRDGFKLTDPRMSPRQVLSEVHYCIYCHERDKDSCSKGLFTGKEGPVKKNPLGIPLDGCPLDEKISEAHWLMRQGDPLAALATIAIDNPMMPGTGHRICNDCMKSCIYQKQDPVNIPQIETGILTDLLRLPWGFEIWSLLTRWNPLNRARPVALPYNGKNVLVVGLGPAGYTLAHYLINEGFGVVGIDGLKIEPLPEDLTGGDDRPPRPVKDVRELTVDLDQRMLAGFGGVSEYGITVRWDKNFLTLLHLNLVRRRLARFYGGVRFGGTLTLDDVWARGFDHVAIAAGAGKPTLTGMKNDLVRGIRTASDFLMALQLTGAFKKGSLANLQVQLPAIVIGGGLTAIDTATELMAYYPVQVEKLLDRYEKLEASLGHDRVWLNLDEEERHIFATFLEHGRAVRAERRRAVEAGAAPDFVKLVKAWGGVSLVYRKGMADSPAYRLNHEEIIKALEEGIQFVERLSPTEALADGHGAVAALRFEKMAVVDGKWRGTGDTVELPARSVYIAAGTSPNVIYEREHPGTFQLDRWNEFFLGHRAVKKHGRFVLEPVGEDAPEPGFFTSYAKDGKLVSYYGDNHPIYAGNVVKAMASAKFGYPKVAELFADQVRDLDPAGETERLERFRALAASLDQDLRPRVVEVNRLTPTIVEVVVKAPLAAREFHPGQFYRLQNYEARARRILDTRLMMEGLALTGAWVDRERGLLSLIVLEMGASSRLVAALEPGEPVVVMGPTGTPTEIPRDQTVLLAGGGLGNAVLFSIARALRDNGNKVVYFAGYKRKEDLFKRTEIEAGTDQVIWSVDSGDRIEPDRPQDHTFQGNIVQAMVAYAEGRLGGAPRFPLETVERIIAIGSDRMMAAVKKARHEVLAAYLRGRHVGIGSINSSMQCMMKEVCGQCLQKHVDPVTGDESFVFSCFNQDQLLDEVDFRNLNERLKTNSVQEKLANHWLEYLLTQADVPRA